MYLNFLSIFPPCMYMSCTRRTEICINQRHFSPLYIRRMERKLNNKKRDLLQGRKRPAGPGKLTGKLYNLKEKDAVKGKGVYRGWTEIINNRCPDLSQGNFFLTYIYTYHVYVYMYTTHHIHKHVHTRTYIHIICIHQYMYLDICRECLPCEELQAEDCTAHVRHMLRSPVSST
jgi:hypothetical protein